MRLRLSFQFMHNQLSACAVNLLRLVVPNNASPPVELRCSVFVAVIYEDLWELHSPPAHYYMARGFQGGVARADYKLQCWYNP